MIVKNLLVVGVVAGFASAAAAEDSKGNWSVGGRVRVDAEQMSTEFKPNGGDKTTGKSSEVKLNRAQFTLTGNRGANDSLAITYYANSSELYSAVISHKFSDMVTAHFGKMKVLALGVENSYEEIDTYITSIAGKAAPMNSTGARLDFGFGDHTVSVQAVEGVRSWSTMVEDGVGNSSTDASTFEPRGGLTSALQYRGNLNNGMIKPVVTYTQVRSSSTKGAGKVTNEIMGQKDSVDYTSDYKNGLANMLGVGAQINTAGAVIDLEYDSITNPKQKDSDEKDVKVSSVVAQVKYAVGSSTPFLKVTSDSKKFGLDKDFGDQTAMNLALGVEHNLDASCRLHAFYMSKALTMKNMEGKDNKHTTTGFNFGVTASM